ncbi:DUF1963 domain-containing protein [Lentzea sp. NPDC092896]|uniref:DUF1963 domain-containing protein n=1 Tax=Lentzea sp. NPDC092896 TaxID=3364127 RepID=UPI003808E55A
MDRYEQFRHAAIDRGLPEDEAAEFAAHLRFEIRLGAGPDEKVVAQSGGLPRLPVGVEWPASGNGSPLPFIASIDCGLLPRAEGLPLPVDGSLLLFLHHEEDVEAEAHTSEPDHARALYVPAGADTAVASPPPDHATRALFYEDDTPFLLPEGQMSAWIQPVLPDWIEAEDPESEPEAVKQLLDELKHVDELCELVDELWPEPDGSCFLRLGGYCEEIGGQNPPWTQMADAHLRNSAAAGLRGPERFRLLHEEEHRLIREWVPLAQFYTTSDLYYGCFLISFDDLAAGRFDQMRSFTMFTE